MLKIIDESTIGILDFVGNRQYISVGNITKNPKVSLILVSYPQRARLKILAEAEILELNDDPELFETLKPTDYKFKPERMMVFHIKAYDWNCPQHITPRYTIEDIEEIFEKNKTYITNLEKQIADLKVALTRQVK